MGTGTSQVLVLDLESRAGSLRGIVRVVVCGDGAGCYVVSENGAGEDLIGGFGLVGWDFVAGLENTREGEIAILPDLAAYVRVVGGDVGVSRVVEFFALAVGYVQRHVFAAEPVTYVVSIAIYKCEFDA